MKYLFFWLRKDDRLPNQRESTFKIFTIDNKISINNIPRKRQQNWPTYVELNSIYHYQSRNCLRVVLWSDESRFFLLSLVSLPSDPLKLAFSRHAISRPLRILYRKHDGIANQAFCDNKHSVSSKRLIDSDCAWFAIFFITTKPIHIIIACARRFWV